MICDDVTGRDGPEPQPHIRGASRRMGRAARRDSGFRRDRIAQQWVNRKQAERPGVIPDEADQGPAQDNGSDAANPVTTGHGDAASQSRKRRRCKETEGKRFPSCFRDARSAV
jgi:hypothetical protein